MTKLVAVFTSKKEMAQFVVSAKACNFDSPVCGDTVCMVNFTIAVKSAASFVMSLADRLNGSVYDAA